MIPNCGLVGRSPRVRLDGMPLAKMTSLPPRASLRLKSSCPDVSEFRSLVSVWKAMYARIHDRDVNRAADLPCLLLRRREGPRRDSPAPKLTPDAYFRDQ